MPHADQRGTASPRPIIATIAVMLAVAGAASLLYFSALSMGQLDTSTETATGAAMIAAIGAWLNSRRQLRTGRRLTNQRDRTLATTTS